MAEVLAGCLLPRDGVLTTMDNTTANHALLSHSLKFCDPGTADNLSLLILLSKALLGQGKKKSILGELAVLEVICHYTWVAQTCHCILFSWGKSSHQ